MKEVAPGIPTEYRVAKWFMVIMLIGPIMFLICGILAFLNPANVKERILIGVVFFVGSLIAFGICWFLVYKRMLVSLDSETITVRSAFTTRSARLSEIRGYRYGYKRSFQLIVENGRPLQISGGLENRSILLDWVRRNWPEIER